MRKNHIDSIEDMEIRKGDMYLMEEKEVYHGNKPTAYVRKIKVFRSRDAIATMKAVNDFIKDKDVIRIHYATSVNQSAYEQCIYDSVLVEYWEHEEEK